MWLNDMKVNAPFPSAPSSCRGSQGRCAVDRTSQSPQHTWTHRSHTPNVLGWWWPVERRGSAAPRTGWSLRPAPECSQRSSCEDRTAIYYQCFWLVALNKTQIKNNLCLWTTSSPCCIRIPNYDISVSPRDDTTLAWVQVVDLCSIWARHCHKTILIHFSSNLQV